MGMLDWIRTPMIGPGPLGNGVWRRVHDRFARAVRRYRAVIEVVPSRPVRVELLEIAYTFVYPLIPIGLFLAIREGIPAERYWTIVSEFEVKSMTDFENMMQGEGMTEETGKEFEKIMEGYHDLVDHGRREIYKIES